jgi:hypothetical protein
MPDASESRVLLIVTASLLVAAVLIASLGSRIISQSASQPHRQIGSNDPTSDHARQRECN